MILIDLSARMHQSSLEIIISFGCVTSAQFINPQEHRVHNYSSSVSNRLLKCTGHSFHTILNLRPFHFTDLTDLRDEMTEIVNLCWLNVAYLELPNILSWRMKKRVSMKWIRTLTLTIFSLESGQRLRGDVRYS